MPDVVYTHNWMLYSYLAAAQNAETPPVVACLHDYWPICPARNLYSGGRACRHDTRRAMLRCAIGHYGPVKGLALGLSLWDARRRWHPRVDRYLAVSEFVAKACEPALGGRPVYEAPTFVPANLAATASDAARPDFVPAGPYMLYVGGLGEHKGVRILADAHRLLGPTALPLVVLGTPAPGQPITWPAGVQVRHNVSHRDVMAAWKYASLGLIPSTWPEPFGQVAVEAMAMGVPLVASNVGGLGDLVAKHPAAVLVTPNSPAALAIGIRQALSEPDLLPRARALAPAVAEQFTTAAGATVVEDHLLDAVAQQRTICG
jgi:glycosyltransferase involved in cell wall biosynthesis